MNHLSLLVSILILGYTLKVIYKEDELLVIPHNSVVEDRIFKCVAFVSVLAIIYTVIYKGVKNGLLISLFSWCFFMVVTPMPEAGIMFTVPLKYMTKIPLEKGHVIISAFAVAIVFAFYTFGHNIVKETTVSELFTYIMNNRLYHMILLSIASSVIMSKFLNDVIDAYTQKDMIFLLNETNQNLAILAFISVFIYIQSIYHYNINIKY